MIINLSHYKGGVGKTTLATNLAVVLNASILDLDTQNSCILFNQLRKSSNYKPIECFTAQTVKDIKDIFTNFIDNEKILIVDSGGYDNNLNRFAMMYSNMLITPVSPSQVEIFGLQMYERVLLEISKESKLNYKSNVIINNADVRSKGYTQQLKKFVRERSNTFDMFSTVVYNRIHYKKAYAEGLSVAELDANSKASDEIKILAKEIMEEFKGGN